MGSKIKLMVYTALLLLPGLQTFGLLSFSDAVNTENRQLAAWPAWTADTQAAGYRDQIDAYFNDHLGYKTAFVKLLNHWKYHLFNELSSKQVSAGGNGFVYLNSHDAKGNGALFKEVCSPPGAFGALPKRFGQGVAAFHEAMQAQGRDGVVLMVPTKSKTYPENLPASFRALCENRPSWLEQLVDEVSAPYFLYPVALFDQWKGQFDVYLSKRFHWVGRAPKQTAEWLMGLWQVGPLSEPGERIEAVPSDLNSHALGLGFEDQSSVYDYAELITERCVSADCLPDFRAHYQHGVLRHFQTQADNGLRLLVLSDSFGPFLDAHFTTGFEHIYSVELNQLQRDEELGFFRWITATTDPDFVLVLIHDGGAIWQLDRLHRVFSAW